MYIFLRRRCYDTFPDFSFIRHLELSLLKALVLSTHYIIFRIYPVVAVIFLIIFLIIVTHVMVEMCCKNESEVGVNESHSSLEVTNLVGPGFLLPCIFIIGMNRILLKGCLTYVLTTRCIVMLEDFMPYIWVCFVPPYFYLRNPNLRIYVWNLITRKNSVNDQNELVELQVMWNTQFDSNRNAECLQSSWNPIKTSTKKMDLLSLVEKYFANWFLI